MRTTKTNRSLWLSIVFVLVVSLLAGIGTSCYQGQTSTPTPAVVSPTAAVISPDASNFWRQVFFTTPKYPDRAADHTGGIDGNLTDFINSAQSTIDMAIYQFDLPNATAAMVKAKQSGRQVRVVTDIDILDDAKENPSFKAMEAAGIPVVGGNPNAIMHDKFVVVDNRAVWTGSWNFTVNDTYRYNNNAIVIQSPELANNYTTVFEKMWRDKKFGPSRKTGGTTSVLSIQGVAVESYFAPEDPVTKHMLSRLQSAQTSVDFLAFSFTEDTLGNALIERANSGAKIRGVFETTGSETKYSEYGRLKTAGLDVLQDGNSYLMHHKVFIIDGRTVIFGSFNFSNNAQEENDENLLIIHDSDLATEFSGEFQRVYDQAKARH
jgi:phosphatidylserine/phosphatidylglycerophosphate/cardiolipin synthase-like enzyme